MIRTVPTQRSWSLSDYAAISHLADAVRELRVEASMLIPTLRDTTVWMVNSTEHGGGVAEMLPQMTALLQELGITTRWIVVGADDPEFFRLTKHTHNLLHGTGEPHLSESDRELYEATCLENANALKPLVRPRDIVVIHDPQPFATGAILKQTIGVRTIWRCHIGHDEHSPATRAGWHFLRRYAEAYDQAVFSAPEYIPDYFAGRATIIRPAVDPCSHKNRELPPDKLVGILCNAKLMREHHPVLTPSFPHPAQRLQPDGTWSVAADGDEIGLLFRPIVTQVSRWDRLKGFGPLLEGFAHLKRSAGENGRTDRHARRIQLVRLVLAGPDPKSVQDDPEGREVLDELSHAYCRLPPALQREIVLLSLPMASRKENALMVNALQRCSTVVVQNSLREGFGLTATEAMWKSVCVVGTRACGLRQQIRSGIDGVLIQNPEDPEEIARRIDDILDDAPKRDYMARNGRQRVHQEFLIFTQLCHWLRVLSACASAPSRPGHAKATAP